MYFGISFVHIFTHQLLDTRFWLLILLLCVLVTIDGVWIG
jgi:hypothetical protein